ncbi:hypothetical protein DSO57_1004492 [Entomophthora muscae]|nr:hypothetical protein DSO57_1004492 [Entomophthora muscae]
MTLIEDPKIAETYEDVRDDKTETNWMFLGFVNDKADILEVKATGTDGLSGFTSNLSPDQAGFGFLRIPLKNDEYSERIKFVFVSYCGPQVRVMRKAKLGIQKAQVQSVLRSFAIEMNVTEAKDLDESEVLLRLKRAGGANYDR